jgi:hypothetical protein
MVGESISWPFQYEHTSSRRWHSRLTMLKACFGGMLFGFDSGIIGGVLTLPAFKA